MSKKAPVKTAFPWRPSDIAWIPLEAKAAKERRPINQILNEIVYDYFTPKLFQSATEVRSEQQAKKAVVKRVLAPKKQQAKKTAKS